MIPLIGAIGVGILICVLFWLDRDDARISNAIWVPYAWLLIASSRPISSWLTLSAPGEMLPTHILTGVLLIATF